MKYCAAATPTRTRRGFIALYAFVMLLLLGILGIAYWTASRMSTSSIVNEARRIKARNFAQAGAEKVRINILNQYHLGNRDMSYQSGFVTGRIDQEYNIIFPDGSFRVDYVKPYVVPGSNRYFINLPYLKNRIQIGHYDVWEISVTGESGGVSVNLRTLIKIIRNFVKYD